MNFFTNVLVPAGVYIAIITGILMVLAIVLNMVRDPKGAVKSVAGFGAILAMIFIFYSMADGTNPSDTMEATEGTVKMVEAGIRTNFIMVIIAGVGLVGSIVLGIFKS